MAVLTSIDAFVRECQPIKGELIMRVFLTGASGWIGAAVVPELLGAGHEVVDWPVPTPRPPPSWLPEPKCPRSLDDPRVFATEPHSVTASCTWVTTTTFTDGGGRENRSQRHRGHRFGVQRERSTLVVAGGVLGLSSDGSRPRTTSPSRHPSPQCQRRVCVVAGPQRCSLVVRAICANRPRRR